MLTKVRPDFVHPLHTASFSTAVSSMMLVVESASQTGLVDVLTHSSWVPEMSPHTLHTPVDRHLCAPEHPSWTLFITLHTLHSPVERHLRLFGHLPTLVPSP